MTAVSFRQSLFYTADHPLTIETAYRSYAAYAGLHDVEIQNRNPWLDPAMWNYDDGIWTVDSTGIVGTSPDSSAYGILSFPGEGVELLHSSVIEFLAEGTGRYFFKHKDAANYFEIEWSDSVLKINRRQNNQPKTLSAMPFGIDGEVEFRVMFREMQYSADQDDRWINVAVWVDGEYIMAGSQRIYLEVLGTGMGFEVQGTDSTVSWTQEYHPVFSIPIDWASLDPGEVPMGGLQRSIGERHLKHFVKFDGTLVILRPGTKETSTDIDASDYNELYTETDIRSLVNHLRVWSAYGHAEVFDEELVNLYGRRFEEITNPDVYTNQEALLEARIILEISKSNYKSSSFSMPLLPLFQPEDVIDTPKGKQIINSGDVEITRTKAQMTINARSYIYE